MTEHSIPGSVEFKDKNGNLLFRLTYRDLYDFVTTEEDLMRLIEAVAHTVEECQVNREEMSQ